MIFWNYKLLAKRLHEKKLSNIEKVFCILISFAFGLFSFFISQLIAVLLWHMMMPFYERRLMNRIRLGEFLSSILILSLPSYIRQTIYGLLVYGGLFLLIFLSSLNSITQDNSHLVTFTLVYGKVLIFILLILLVICIFDMYQALKYFSHLTFKAWEKEHKKPSHLDKLDGDASL